MWSPARSNYATRTGMSWPLRKEPCSVAAVHPPQSRSVTAPTQRSVSKLRHRQCPIRRRRAERGLAFRQATQVRGLQIPTQLVRIGAKEPKKSAPQRSSHTRRCPRPQPTAWANTLPGSIASYYWSGAWGTIFLVDPAKKLIATKNGHRAAPRLRQFRIVHPDLARPAKGLMARPRRRIAGLDQHWNSKQSSHLHWPSRPRTPDRPFDERIPRDHAGLVDRFVKDIVAGSLPDPFRL